MRQEPTRNTIAQEKIRMTIVRIAVATLELTPRIPIFARIAVTPAKKAEPKANRIQLMLRTSNTNSG